MLLLFNNQEWDLVNHNNLECNRNLDNHNLDNHNMELDNNNLDNHNNLEDNIHNLLNHKFEEKRKFLHRLYFICIQHMN